MKKGWIKRQSLAPAITLLMVLVTVSAVAADVQGITLVSGPIGGGLGSDNSQVSSISDDGKLVTFDSSARNLLPGDPEGDNYFDIFLYDQRSPGTPVMHKITAGSNGNSYYPVITDDSIDRYYIVFQSRSTTFTEFGLEESDPNNSYSDIFIYYYLPNGTSSIKAVSRTYNDAPPNGHSGDVPHLQAYTSQHNLANPIHPGADVYLGLSGEPYVVFESNASNMVADDTNGKRDIFLRSLNDSTTTLLTRNTSGALANGDCTHPVVSNNGRFVVFVSTATNLVDGVDTSGLPNVYLLDRNHDNDAVLDDDWTSGGVKFYLVSRVDGNGAAANDESWYPSVTYANPDGDLHYSVYVAFQSYATNLVAGDTNNASDVFLYTLDVDWGEATSMERISVNSNGTQGNFHTITPSISSDAMIVSFASYATNMVDGDNNYNCVFNFPEGTWTNCPDVFVRNWVEGQTWRVSLTFEGEQADMNSSLPRLGGPAGRFVSFTTYADLRNHGEQLEKLQVFLRDQGNPAGNPNVQPSYGDFLSNIGQPVWITFDLNFIAPTDVGAIDLEPLSYSEPGPFEFPMNGDDTCSNRHFEAGETCHFTTGFTPPDLTIYRARLAIPCTSFSNIFTVYVSLRGRPAVQYIPIIAP